MHFTRNFFLKLSITITGEDDMSFVIRPVLPIPPPLMGSAHHWENIQELMESIFEVSTYTRYNGTDIIGTAWVIEKQDQGSNLPYKYLAVTNAHVVDAPEKDEISFEVVDYSRTKRFAVQLVGVDHIFDLAVISFESDEDIPILPLAATAAKVGDRVAIIGNQLANGIVFTPGVVSHADKFAGWWRWPEVQHDTSSAGGNSGSPMLNTKGEVVAIEHAGPENVDGIGFAIPVDFLRQCYESLKKTGKCEHGTRLGTTSLFSDRPTISLLNPNELALLGVNASSGYYINSVLPGSLAARAGIEAGQVLTMVNGRTVPVTSWQLVDYIIQQASGADIQLGVMIPGTQSTALRYVDYPYVTSTAENRDTWQSPFGFGLVKLRPDEEVVIKANFPNYLNGAAIIFPKTNENYPLNGLVVTDINGEALTDLHKLYAIPEQNYNKPIVATVLGTQEHLPFGYQARVLLNPSEPKRYFMMEKLDVKYLVMNTEELKALGCNDEDEGFYITQVRKTIVDERNQPLFIGDVIVGFSDGDKERHFVYTKDDYLFGFIPFGKKLGLTDTFAEQEDPEKEYTLFVRRNGEEIKVKRVVQKCFDISTNPFEFEAHTLDATANTNLGLPKTFQGVFIRNATSINDLPHPYHFESGMIITSFNGKPVRTKEELLGLIDAARTTKQAFVFEVAGNLQWKYPDFRDLWLVRYFATAKPNPAKP